MNDKKRILILLKILDQIQQDKQDAKNCTEKSVTKICTEEGIYRTGILYFAHFVFVFVFTLSF